MKKKILPIIMALLVGGLLLAGLCYFFLQQGEVGQERLTLFGNVDIRQVELAFNGSERIAAIRVEEGASVSKGQVLAVLETRRLHQLVTRAEAQVAGQNQEVRKLQKGTRQEEISKLKAEVAGAKSEAANAARTYQRLQPLAAQALASQEQADEAGARAEISRARLRMAAESLNLAQAGPRQEDIAAASARLEAMKAELEIARTNLEDARLVAPDQGVIQNRILQPGDMASPQRPVFTLALTNPVWVRAYVPQPAMGKIYPGMRARIHSDSYPGKTYEGWIGYISPTAEFTPKSVQTEEVRTDLVYQLRVYACNPQNQLRLGMPATVVIPLDQPAEEGGDIPLCREGP